MNLVLPGSGRLTGSEIFLSLFNFWPGESSTEGTSWVG